MISYGWALLIISISGVYGHCENWADSNLTWVILVDKLTDQNECFDFSRNNLKNMNPQYFESKNWISELVMDGNKGIFPNAIEPFIISSSLLVFRCAECDLKAVSRASFSGLPFLEQLYLRGNAIESMEDNAFADNLNLTHLDLSFNKIIAIPKLNYLTSLVKLNLSHNLKLTIGNNAPVLELAHLNTLILDNCNIQIIYENSFQKLPSVTTITLHNNKITQFSATAFSSLQNLKELTIDEDLFPANNAHEYFNLSLNILINNKKGIVRPTTLTPTSFSSSISTTKTPKVTSTLTPTQTPAPQTFSENATLATATATSGRNYAFITIYLLLMASIQGGLVAVIFLCIIKVKRFEAISTMDYSSTILNDNDIYKVYLK